MSEPRFPELVAHLRDHAVRTGTFTLKSGKTSDWFIDAKQTTCRADGMLLGADAPAFGTAGVAATRGRHLRSFSVRKEVKDHGGGGRIAGALEPGDRVAITEDAVTRGVSMLEAADVVREADAVPVCLVPVVDRGGTCGALAVERGLAYLPLVTAPDLGFGYEG